MGILASSLCFFAAALMFMDAVMYSLGTIQPIRNALQAPDDYWDKRLLLNLLHANMGLYFTAVFTFIGAFIARANAEASLPILIFSIVVCLYSCVSILLLTSKDWRKILPRLLAIVLIVIALFV